MQFAGVLGRIQAGLLQWTHAGFLGRIQVSANPNPVLASIAELASANVTKPKPRRRLVSRSNGMMTSLTFPKALHTSISVRASVSEIKLEVNDEIS